MNKKRKHEGHRERKTGQFKALRKKKKHGEFLKEMLIWRNTEYSTSMFLFIS